MFRVPSNPDAPTFDDTYKVGFFRWLTSGKEERAEWARRRNAGAEVARLQQNAKVQAWAERKQAEKRAKRR